MGFYDILYSGNLAYDLNIFTDLGPKVFVYMSMNPHPLITFKNYNK